jgi:hypothetical protein
MPASRDNLVQLLKKGSVAVTMGGIAEMCAPLPGLTPDAA